MFCLFLLLFYLLCINYIFDVNVLFIFIASAATLINIRNARKHFEKLERMEQVHSAITSS